MELLVRFVNSFLNSVTRSTVVDIFEVLHMPLAVKIFSRIAIAKLLRVKFVFLLVGQRKFFFSFSFLLSVFHIKITC